jgi:hypothetical protein
MSHSGTIFLHILEWILILTAIASAVLIQPFAGEDRGERHSEAKRRYSFYTSVFFTALCICKLMEPHDALWFLWGIFGFVFLGKIFWLAEATRFRHQIRVSLRFLPSASGKREA